MFELMRPLISVIVPVYNSEPYIEKCIRSISSQSYRVIEIIIVDDGSTDGSGHECDRMAEKDNRIKVIHTEHGGVSSARNAGLEEMKGSFFCFVDSDDYVGQDYLEELYRTMIFTRTDISECIYQTVDDDNGQADNTEHIIKVITVQDYIRGIANPKEHFSVLWNKLYRTSVMGGFRFPVGKTHEDQHYINEWMKVVKEISHISSVLYYYRLSPGSIMRRPYSTERISSIEAWIQRYDYVMKNNPELIDLVLWKICDQFFHEVRLIMYENNDPDDRIKEALVTTTFAVFDDMMVCPMISAERKKQLQDCKDGKSSFYSSLI